MNKDPYFRLANKYDRIIEPFNRLVRKIGFHMFPPQAGMRILDVGCGTGTNMILYHNAGCEVHGIDRSPAMLGVARDKLGERAHLYCCDAANIPYASSTFDLITAMLTLHEMPGEIRKQVMSEMVRVLKLEGRILLIDFHAGELQFPKGWFYKMATYFLEMSAGGDHFNNFRNFINHKGLPALLGDGNLIIEKMKIISGGNLALFLVRRMFVNPGI